MRGKCPVGCCTKIFYRPVGRGDPTPPGGLPAGLHYRDATCRGAGCLKPTLRPLRCFYPRPPWGGRQPIYLAGIYDNIFLSTPSVGRATQELRPALLCPFNFYPRPPWGGRPSPATAPARWGAYFYPRPPWGGRRAFHQPDQHKHIISIHALRGEGDARARAQSTKRWTFLSTPSVGRATRLIKPPRAPKTYFYPRPPWGGRQQKYTKILCIFCAKGTIVSPPGGAIRRAATKQPLQHSTT